MSFVGRQSARWSCGRVTRPGEFEGDFVEVAPAPVLARLGGADDRMAGLARRAGWRGGSARSRSSRSSRTSCTCAGAPSVSPIARQSSQPAISSGSDVTSMLSRCVQTALIGDSHLDQRGRVIGAAVNRSVQEERRRAVNLAGIEAAIDVSPDAPKTAPLARSSSNRSASRARSRA